MKYDPVHLLPAVPAGLQLNRTADLGFSPGQVALHASYPEAGAQSFQSASIA
jgi:hypothetical protein